MNKLLLTFVSAAALLAGCTSNIRPIQPVRRVETWVPDAPATQPTTQVATTESTTLPTTEPSTQAASTQSSTQPSSPSHAGEHLVVKIIDPNQTSRYIYKASYDNIWQQAVLLLHNTGFALDRKDYRLGILTTQPLASTQILEFWKPQQTNPKNALENTVNSQQRSVRLTISPVEGKPDFLEIAIEVLVERQSNPIENIGGPVFVEGSGFGRNMTTLRSDYAPPDVTGIGPAWYVIGHDPNLEHKLLSELFKHI